MDIKTKRVLETLYKLHHNVMLAVMEDDSLGTVGEEFKSSVEIAEASANVLAVKIANKG